MPPVADLHTHTISSGHAFSTLSELAAAAADQGLAVLGVTDHGPTMTGAPTHGYFEMAHRLPSHLHGVRILLGCEANILDHTGRIDIDDDWAPRQPLILAGLHARSPYPTGSTATQNTDAVVGAIADPHVHVISHPYRAGFRIDPVAVATAAAAHRTLLEVNLSMFRTILAGEPDLSAHPAVTATRALLEHLQAEGGAFVLGSDAHHASEIATNYAAAEKICALVGTTPEAAANFDRARLAAFIPALRS